MAERITEIMPVGWTPKGLAARVTRRVDVIRKRREPILGGADEEVEVLDYEDRVTTQYFSDQEAFDAFVEVFRNG